MLDALGGRAGPEDTRTRAQRDHDALEEACLHLIARPGRRLPGRAGQPTSIQLHMTLSQLLGQHEADQAAAWIAATAVQRVPATEAAGGLDGGE